MVRPRWEQRAAVTVATRSSRARHGAPQGSTGDSRGSPCATNDFPLPTHIRNPEPGTKYTLFVRSGRPRSHHDRGPSPDILPRNRAQAPGPASPPESWSPTECRIAPTISPRSLVISWGTPWNSILHIRCSSKMPLRGDKWNWCSRYCHFYDDTELNQGCEYSILGGRPRTAVQGGHIGFRPSPWSANSQSDVLYTSYIIPGPSRPRNVSIVTYPDPGAVVRENPVVAYAWNPRVATVISFEVGHRTYGTFCST